MTYYRMLIYNIDIDKDEGKSKEKLLGMFDKEHSYDQSEVG